MRFCPSCRNFLYVIDEEVVDGKQVAFEKCHKCEFKQAITRTNPLVYEHVLQQDKTASFAVNPYIEYDRTLDHLKNVECPNKECPTKDKHGPEKDVVPIELNSEELVWMYKCVNCKTMWKQNSRDT
jgi:DNA-directed RNA polymerase subunit M/transcription elongation factor TFIIS